MYLRYRCRSCTADFILEFKAPGPSEQQPAFLDRVGRQMGEHHKQARPGCPSIFTHQSSLEAIFDVNNDGPEWLEQLTWPGDGHGNDDTD